MIVVFILASICLVLLVTLHIDGAITVIDSQLVYQQHPQKQQL